MYQKKGIGIPGGLFFYRYRPFITNFADSIDIDIKFSTKTNNSILRAGEKICNERTCTAEKIFEGHCDNLRERGYDIFTPAEFKSQSGGKSCSLDTFSKYDAEVFFKDELWSAAEKLGSKRRNFERAFDNGLHAQKYTVRGFNNLGYKCKVLLTGRPYNIYDEYVNMNIVSKLHRMNIGVVTSERLSDKEQDGIDGVIYVCCFGCRNDSARIDYLRERFSELPFVIIQTGQHLYTACMLSRLEAFKYLIDQRRR
ncbi:MAG: acyl-CoA dehydratase activase-related protein [Eubacteriales bacterium]|nr:acyl-CoA dehydratase activase-related protein [Eubacteriales bacterium]MDD4389250.1 acyl-CoA dehydratase activase-related protein [Eubacteriales bacterium]